MNARNIFKLLFYIVLIFSQLNSLASNNLTKRYNQSSNAYEKLKITVEGMNKMYPMMMNKDLRLDNVIALPNMEMSYMYTYLNHDKKDLNISTAYVDKLKMQAIQAIRSLPNTTFYKENKVSFSFFYKDRTGKIVHSIIIDKDDLWGNNAISSSSGQDFWSEDKSNINKKQGIGDILHERARDTRFAPSFDKDGREPYDTFDYDRLAKFEREKRNGKVRDTLLIVACVALLVLLVMYIIKIRKK